jgi:hypothetical protein
MASDTIFRQDDISNLESLHYYGWEFPGKTWEGIPEDIVKAGLDGLDAFLRIAHWSQDKRDPQPETTTPKEIPF